MEDRYKPIIVDQFNMQSLIALRAKLHRDYLGFFGNLSNLYKKGERKNELNYIIDKIRRAIKQLDTVLASGKIKSTDANEIISQIEEINESRDVFTSDVKKIDALRKKVNKVVETTGISLSDLNLTENVVREGLALAIKSKKKAGSPLERKMPRTYWEGRKLLKGIETAVLGPFAPLADIISGGVKDIAGLVRGMRKKGLERREERFGERLGPMAYGLPPRKYEDMMHERKIPPMVRGFGGYSTKESMRKPDKEEQVAPLTYFFGKKAYQTKWTKELLDRIRGIGVKDGSGFGGILSGLMHKFMDLGKWIMPLIGKGGVFALLAADMLWAIPQIKKFLNALGEREKALGELRKSGKASDVAKAQKEEKIAEIGADEYARRVGKTPRQVAIDVVSARQKAIMRRKMEEAPWIKPLRFWGRMLGMEEKPEKQLAPFYTQVKAFEKARGVPCGAPFVPIRINGKIPISGWSELKLRRGDIREL